MSADAYDTSVVLYLASASSRADVVENLLRSGGLISVQVLNETASVMLRKWKSDWSDVTATLVLLRTVCDVVPLTLDIHMRGLKLAERYRYALYDALLLASALSAQCTTFWSEDMQDGQVIDGTLTIRNPFA